MRVERIIFYFFGRCLCDTNTPYAPRGWGTGLFRGTNNLKWGQVFDFLILFRAPLMWGTCPTGLPVPRTPYISPVGGYYGAGQGHPGHGTRAWGRKKDIFLFLTEPDCGP